ncbi:MAG: M15 family metallopeptidase [Oscillospiraceae bacterium]|nr:M15 family metallopeptidase [Oscillospiraceae bacterium]
MSNKKKEKKQNGAARFFDVLLALALCAGIGYGGYYVATHGTAVEQKDNYTANLPEETTEPPTEPQQIYDTVEISNQEIHEGNLILVNYELPFSGSEENLVSLYQVMLEKDCHSFGARDADVKVQRVYAEQLIALFDAFYNESFDNNIIVQSGYRSPQRQQELYDADLASTGLEESERVAKAGYSEHQTGLCVDLSLFEADYDGTGIYSYIDEHCADYGIILRYPENKTEVTRIAFEPWHYRYVGIPHAAYVRNNNICLEEYITLLYGYDYESEHLQIADQQNELYEIYYYPADTSGETTMLPVPADKEYSVSGNNRDGFIVTFDTGKQAEPQTDTIPEEETPAQEETDSVQETNS